MRNMGEITDLQTSITFFKVGGLDELNLTPREMIEKLNKNRLNPEMESPRKGFTQILQSGNEILIEYTLEAPNSSKSLIFEEGRPTIKEAVTYSPRIIEAHLRFKSGLLEVYTASRRYLGLFLLDLSNSFDGKITIDRIIFSEDFLEGLLMESEDLRRIKLDGLDDPSLAEITLKGELIDSTEAYKHYKTDKQGKIKEFHIKFYTPFGKRTTLIVARDGRFKIYRSGDTLTWEDIEGMNDRIDEMI